MKSRFLAVVIFSSIFLYINAEELTLSSSSHTCGRQSTQHWPWHVAVYHIGVPSLRSPKSDIKVKTPQYKCSGTMINKNTILTAAHCVTRYYQSLNKENVLVSLGKQNLSESSSSEFLKTTNIMQHPNYSPVNLSHNIALIKLSVEVTFDNHTQPICLWDSNKSELSEVMGKTGTVVGWGKTATGSTWETIQQANMLVVDHLTCLESDRRTFGAFMSRNTFCAGFRNGTSTCISDTGGALTFEENGVSYIRGIFSLFKFVKTDETCDPNEYTLFTDIAPYLSWIADAAEWKCEKRVSCYWSVDLDLVCNVNLNISLTEGNCKVIIENASEKPLEKISTLEITGNIEVLPDLSDVFDIFQDIFVFYVKTEPQSKLSIQQKQLSAARRISMLRFGSNRIEEIAPDTFDDLSQLLELDLKDNRLKVIHQDTFKELYKLRRVYLERNDLEVLPEGLFRNNRDLSMAVLQSNKLKIIATDFRDLPKLSGLFIKGNVCIDEEFYIKTRPYTPIMEVQTKIWSQCKG